MGDEGKPIDVYEYAVKMLEMWASIAWAKMGLTPDIMTGTVGMDLPQAKVAINVASLLADTVEGQLDEEDRRRVQGLVRDLKINYVQKSKEGTA